MSTIDQYSVYDCLTGQAGARSFAVDAVDEYAGYVSVFGHSTLNSFTINPSHSVVFTEKYNGDKISPSSVFNFGSEDFSIELSFRLPRTYSSELFAQLKLIDPPIFYTGEYTVHNNQIALYINNDLKPVGVGLNGLQLVLTDSAGVMVTVALAAADFNTWIADPQYKNLVVGRRGQTFYMYANGIFYKETTAAGFGAINMPGAEDCYLFCTEAHAVLNNFVSFMRVTKGLSRPTGLQHLHIADADITLQPSSPRTLREKELGGALLPITDSVTIPPKRGTVLPLLSGGHLFQFDASSVRTKTVNDSIESVRSITSTKALTPFGGGPYIYLTDDGLHAKLTHFRLSESFDYPVVFVVFSAGEGAGTVSQRILTLKTDYANESGTWRAKMVTVDYLDGVFTVKCIRVAYFEDLVNTYTTATIDIGDAVSNNIIFGIARTSGGLYCYTINGLTAVAYNTFTTFLEADICKTTPGLLFKELFYYSGNISTVDIADAYAFFTKRYGALRLVNDTASTDAETEASGNVLTNDPAGLVVSKVGGLSTNVGVAVAGDNGGLFTIASNGAWTFDPDGDFALLTGSETAETSVMYHASDGVSEAGATLTITVSSGAAPALWTPAQLTTAQWLDAADTSTLTLDGAAISQISDKSGNNRHATQTGTSRPTHSGSLAVFDGANDYFNISVPQSRPSHVFAVLDTTALQTGWRAFMERTVGSEPYPPALYLGTNSAAQRPAIYWGNSIVLVDSTARQNLRIQEYRIGSGVVGLRSGGGTELTATTSQSVLSTWIEINTVPTYSQQSAFSLGEILIINQALSDDDRQRVEGYLAHKWDAILGVTTLVAALPSGHPYKTSPPTI